jgi:hypothetical protein
MPVMVGVRLTLLGLTCPDPRFGSGFEVPLIDDLRHSAIYFIFPFGKGDHFRIEIQSAIPIIRIQCLDDFTIGLDANKFARLQIELRFRYRGAFERAEWPQWVWRAADSTLESVIDPPQCRTDS